MATTGDVEQRRRRSVKAWVWLLGAVYGLCLLVVAAAAFVVVNTAEDTCAFGDGAWGRQGTESWSWFPVGQTCKYDVTEVGEGGAPERVVHVDPPSPFVTVALALLVIAPAGAVVGYQLGRERASV